MSVESTIQALQLIFLIIQISLLEPELQPLDYDPIRAQFKWSRTISRQNLRITNFFFPPKIIAPQDLQTCPVSKKSMTTLAKFVTPGMVSAICVCGSIPVELDEKALSLKMRETIYFLKGHVNASKISHICSFEILNWHQNSKSKILQNRCFSGTLGLITLKLIKIEGWNKLWVRGYTMAIRSATKVKDLRLLRRSEVKGQKPFLWFRNCARTFKFIFSTWFCAP